jgi:DNA-binding protein H-NS
MDAINVEKLDDGQLDELQATVAKEIQKRATKRQADAKRQIMDIASKHDIDLAALTSSSRSSEKSAAKYRDPDNQLATWTGRGRKPAWLEAQLKAGKTLESMAITS